VKQQQIKYILIIIFIVVVAIITTLKLFNIIYVSQMVGALILVIIFLVVILSGTIASKTVPKLGKDVIITFVIILGLLVFTTYVSVSTQIFPINSIQSQFDLRGMTIILNREPTVMIPLYSAPGFTPRDTAITTTIYHNPDDIIKEVKLSASSDSILSFEPNFKKINDSTKVNNTEIDKYQLQAKAQHNLMVNNYTKPYSMDILYFNKTAQLNDLPFTFDWPAKTADLSPFSYFWIVLIGVMVSRLLSLILDKIDKAKQVVEADTTGKNLQQALEEQKPISLTVNDTIWIAFSFIIALLIFSSFSGQVHLTTNILTNVTLAFGFGFGFDKVLEVAKRFEGIV
jgi:hypothetical protein